MVAVALAAAGQAADRGQKEINPPLATDIYVQLVIVGEGWSQQVLLKNLAAEVWGLIAASVTAWVTLQKVQGRKA